MHKGELNLQRSYSTGTPLTFWVFLSGKDGQLHQCHALQDLKTANHFYRILHQYQDAIEEESLAALANRKYFIAGRESLNYYVKGYIAQTDYIYHSKLGQQLYERTQAIWEKKLAFGESLKACSPILSLDMHTLKSNYERQWTQPELATPSKTAHALAPTTPNHRSGRPPNRPQAARRLELERMPSSSVAFDIIQKCKAVNSIQPRKPQEENTLFFHPIDQNYQVQGPNPFLQPAQIMFGSFGGAPERDYSLQNK